MSGKVNLHRGDLLEVDCQVVVNAANSSLMGGGGVDGAIHRAAGPDLKRACSPLAPCPPGEVRVTPGFGLGDRLVFHTVGPVWRGGEAGESLLLESCYRNCLKELIDRELDSIVFPAISTGAYGYPADDAAEIAVTVCREYAGRHKIVVTLAAFDELAAEVLEQALA